MKSYTQYISLLILACLGMVSCDEYTLAELDNIQGMELTVSCVNNNATRAEEKAGEDTYNENLIKTLHYFFYASNADENTPAVMSGKIDLQAGTMGQTVVRIPMSEAELNTVVFPRPNETCKVFLIANLPDNVTLPTDDTSLSKLKQLAIVTDFEVQEKQPSFVMAGEGTATIENRSKTVAAKGNIQLKRLATKFTTRITVEEQYEEVQNIGGQEQRTIWKPDVENMQVFFEYAAKNTTLGAAMGNIFFNYAGRKRMGTKEETLENGGQRTQHVFAPFYSYPRQWEYTQENALAMFIMLPWANEKDGYTQYSSCWYKVYPNVLTLESNSWYNMDLHIGVLGSFTQNEEPVTINDITYSVMDWNNESQELDYALKLNTDLLGAHYLVVEQNHYVVNNKNTFEIPFITSHECIIRDYTGDTDDNTNNDFKVTKKIFIKNNNNPVPVNEDQDITDQARNGSWITIEGNTIKLNHALNNDFINTKTYDYTPYEFTFYICHKNNPDKFQEKITITQKPALSVTAQKNSGTGDTYNGYQFVNGHKAVHDPAERNHSDNINGKAYPCYGGAMGLEGMTTNPYMYIIEISVLPAGSEFILGDPRTATQPDYLDTGNFYPALGFKDGRTRIIENYNCTQKGDGNVENMIAPKFRIASSHSTVGSFISFDDVFNRAATYQEDGYPAGRWRVATKSEIHFVAKLYADGKIPQLFNSGTGYWCNNGKVTPTSGGDANIDYNTGGTYSTRPVYDEWYWENLGDYYRLPENKRNTFTWGDEVSQ